MKYFLITTMAIIVFSSCRSSQKLIDENRSFLGSYLPAAENDSKDEFNATLTFLDCVFFSERKYGIQENRCFPKVKVEISNLSDSLVVVEFPINWNVKFIQELIFFEFRNLESNGLRIESFYPDKVDTINNFFSAQMLVTIPPKETLSFDFHIYTSNEMIKEIRNSESATLDRFAFAIKFDYYFLPKKSRTLESKHLNRYCTEEIFIAKKHILREEDLE